MFAGTQCVTPDSMFKTEILVDGVPQPLYRRIADGTMFVEALVGRAYVVRVTNMSSRRIETVLAIDGRNTQDDEPADVNRSRGLVMRESYDFRGWRDNNASVNAFMFTAPERSIATQATGNTNNVGVIGLAVYREMEPIRPVHYGGGFGQGGYESMKGAPASFGGTTRGGSVGTGMGHQIVDQVGTTTFNRGVGTPTIQVIRYDTADVLERMGLLVSGEPEAFPGAVAFSGKYDRA